jgi:hypothetical protein
MLLVVGFMGDGMYTIFALLVTRFTSWSECGRGLAYPTGG